jgi:predicted CXXCH cytochrome family protein
VASLLVLLAAAAAIPACSEEKRHRVLSFFFDGVPEPGATPPPRGYEPLPSRGQRVFAIPPERAVPEVMTFAHEPFRAGDCTGCHQRTTGELLRPVDQGLCQSCHADVPGPATFVHGPVAVRDCLFCHHPHGSTHPAILVDDATRLCLSCHERTDLTGGAHHAEVDLRACIACHDPHAGDDRSFLKRTER